jgi:hypothetical protein
MHLLPPIVRDLLPALALFWVAIALGRRFLRLLAIPQTVVAPAERTFVCAALGIGFIQYLPFTLGVLGTLSPLHLRISLGVLAALLAPDLIHVARQALAAPSRLRGWRPSRWTLLWLLAIALFLAALVIRSLHVGGMLEDDGYHLTAPKRWMHSGGLDYLPTLSHTNAPMGFEMVYAISLVLGGPAVAQVVHLIAAAFWLLGVFLFGRRVGRPTAGMAAIGCLMIENPLFDLPVLFNQAYVDIPACWLMMAALLLWLIWSQSGNRRALACAGLCAGFAGSFKFTALFAGAGLTVLVAVHLWRRGVGLRAAARPVLMTGVLALAPVLPWLWRTWRVTGNPVYPMFSGLIPTRDWSAAHGQVFEKFFRLYNWATWMPLTEAQRRKILLVSAVLMLAALAIAIWRAKEPVVRSLLIFAAVLTAAALGTTALYFRFLLSPIACVLLAAALATARRWPAAPPAAAALIMAVALLKWGRWALLDLAQGIQVAIGVKAERTDEYMPIWSYLNGNTAPDDRILMAALCASNERTGGVAFWVDRTTYTTDSHLQHVFPLDDWETYRDSIQRAGIRHVVVGDFGATEQRPICSPSAFFPGGRNEYPFARRLVAEYGTLEFHTGRWGVYRMDGLAAATK